jgi:ABC-2 type transport system permease protein
MPGWLQIVATLNPLSYEVDLLRSFMIVGGSSAFGVGRDFVLLLVVDLLLIIVGARVYPRVAQ